MSVSGDMVSALRFERRTMAGGPQTGKSVYEPERRALIITDTTQRPDEPKDGVLIVAGQVYLYRPRLAKLLGKSERTLARWHEKGFGPPYNELLGAYPEAGLPAWLESHNKGPVRKPQRRRKLAATSTSPDGPPAQLHAGRRE
jgi:hypothetical protein